MSFGRIINLRDWRNNKSDRCKRQRERNRKETEYFVLEDQGYYDVILLPECFLTYILFNAALSNIERWDDY
jgi:hypothetical protein